MGRWLVRPWHDYPEQAVRCLRLAQAMAYEPHKALLLEMAQAWVKMAEQGREKENEKVSA